MVDFIRDYFFPEKRPNYVIASLLDETHETIVKNIWHELETELGISHPIANPTPHMTQIQAQAIDSAQLHDAMEQFAAFQPPFTIRTAGLGLFTGEKNAVYVAVVRNPELTRIQTSLIGALTGAMHDISKHHLINHWMPHISLLIPGMGIAQLADVVTLLAQRDFAWEMTIDRISLLGDENMTVELIGEADDG
jgi:2'-5' RNA ligase